ncbi:MAG TPA: hypothetical protein G4O11_12270, partial [Anaerolineae bacterium]|nr:hypothetical protein [Anaerolineae bacterium]
MNQDDSQIHDEQPEVEPSTFEGESMEPEVEAPAAEPELLEEAPPEPVEEVEAAVEVEAPPPSKFRLFLNRALRWVTGLMLVFVLGVVAMWVIRVRPVQAELQSLQTELEAMQQQVATLEE